MPLIDIEKELSNKTTDPKLLNQLREAACLGLKASIEEVERQLNNAKSQGYLPAYIAAQNEALIYLRAMLSRAEKGKPTHSGSSVD